MSCLSRDESGKGSWINDRGLGVRRDKFMRIKIVSRYHADEQINSQTWVVLARIYIKWGNTKWHLDWDDIYADPYFRLWLPRNRSWYRSVIWKTTISKRATKYGRKKRNVTDAWSEKEQHEINNDNNTTTKWMLKNSMYLWFDSQSAVWCDVKRTFQRMHLVSRYFLSLSEKLE